MGEEGRDRDERRQHDREPRPQAHEQPDGLRADEEDPEVVRGERERADHAPPHQPATVATEREPEGEHRRRSEQREQRVRPSLLRVPDEERARRDERGRDDARASGHENTPAPYATGIVAVPASAESDRKPTSPSPKTELQSHATT